MICPRASAGAVATRRASCGWGCKVARPDRRSPRCTSRTVGSRSMRLVGWERSSPCMVNAFRAGRAASATRACVARVRGARAAEYMSPLDASGGLRRRRAPRSRRGSTEGRCSFAVPPQVLGASGIMWSSWAPVTDRPRMPCTRNGKAPTVRVWKWYMRLRPTRSDELAMPWRSNRRGVSNAPAREPRRNRWPGPRVRRRLAVDVSARRLSPAARRGSSTTSVTRLSGRISQRPVRSAWRSGATGSPLASIGQPKKPQNPQLLHAGRPSYGTELAPVGAG